MLMFGLFFVFSIIFGTIAENNRPISNLKKESFQLVIVTTLSRDNLPIGKVIFLHQRFFMQVCIGCQEEIALQFSD